METSFRIRLAFILIRLVSGWHLGEECVATGDAMLTREVEEKSEDCGESEFTFILDERD